MPAAGLTLLTAASDTTLNKPMTYNTSTKEWNYGYWFGSGGGSGWGLTGNAGTTAGTNFVGTTDNVDLVFKRNSVESGRFSASGNLNLGLTGTTLGSLGLSGNTSGLITVKGQAAAGTYNFNLPTTAGTSGYLLTSAGGGASPMTWVAPSSLYPTWQQTLTAGSTLTGNNTVAMGGNDFTFSDAGTLIANTSEGSEIKLEGTFARLIGHGATDRLSELVVSEDELSIKPGLGNLNIDTLTSAVGTKALRYNPTTGLVSYADTTAGGGGSMVYPAAGIAVSTGAAWAASITDNSANWNTAYSQTRQWDGGSTGLVAATGRTSLGGTTIGQNLFTLTNPGTISFARFNADNSVTARSAADYKTDLSLNNVDNTSDASKNSAAVALTNKDLTSGTNTFPTFNQNTTGSAATLTTTRTIWGQNFNGSANVTGDLTLGANNLTMTGSLASTGSRVTKGWFTDIESTNMPTVGGTSLSSTFSPIAGSASITTVGTIGTGTWQGTTINHAYLGTGGGGSSKFLREDNTWQTIAGGGDALVANPLSQFAATTSSQLRGVISDENGTGVALFNAATSPDFTTSITIGSVAVPTISSTHTLTNKRITARTGTATSSATPTINTDNVDFYSLTAQAANITSFTTNLSGTPALADKLWIAITDDGTPRTIAWGASFSGSLLPATTVASTQLNVLLAWNGTTWYCMYAQ